MVFGEYAVGELFLSMLWFFLFFIWIYLLIVIFSDIFRSHDLSGWVKALWTIFIIVLPFLGILVYLIARGSSMAERNLQAKQRSEQQFQAYVQSVVAPSSSSVASELERLAELKAQGVISEEEFATLKAKAMA